MTEQRAILDGAARIHGDTSDSRIEKLLPDPRSNIEARGLPDGCGGATGQVAFDIGLHRGGHLVLTPTRRRSHEGPDTAQFGVTMPIRAPTRPACTAAMTPASSSDSSRGTQSAVSTTNPKFRVVVTTASVTGIGSD